MKVDANNNITDCYLALFLSINCATDTDNRNKKYQEYQSQQQQHFPLFKQMSDSCSWCFSDWFTNVFQLSVHYLYVLRYIKGHNTSTKIELFKFLLSSTHFQIEIYSFKDFILPGYLAKEATTAAMPFLLFFMILTYPILTDKLALFCLVLLLYV